MSFWRGYVMRRRFPAFLENKKGEGCDGTPK